MDSRPFDSPRMTHSAASACELHQFEFQNYFSHSKRERSGVLVLFFAISCVQGFLLEFLFPAVRRELRTLLKTTRFSKEQAILQISACYGY